MRQEPQNLPLILARVDEQIVVEDAAIHVEDELVEELEGDEIDRLMLTAQEHDLDDEC